MIKRGIHFIEVAYFLSRYGPSDPPIMLKTNSWKEAYHMFYEKLNEGREILAFEHSLKNARDAFDSHFPNTQREGYKDSEGQPNKLSRISLEVFNKFKNLTEQEVWQRISQHSNLNSKEYEPIFEILIAIEDSEKKENTAKTEGGLKVFISTRVERDPSLRNDALKAHGYDCAVCGFNFEKTYGVWGKNWAEVHHLVPISESKKEKRKTDPKSDLAVLCANCHRMIHRRKGIALTISELKSKLK
jgi:predicted restriction endonuclease